MRESPSAYAFAVITSRNNQILSGKLSATCSSVRIGVNVDSEKVKLSCSLGKFLLLVWIVSLDRMSTGPIDNK